MGNMIERDYKVNIAIFFSSRAACRSPLVGVKHEGISEEVTVSCHLFPSRKLNARCR